MVVNLIARLFGSKHERDIKRMWPLVEAISAEFEKLQALSDEALAGKTVEFRARLEAGETLEDLLPEAFAVVKEVCRRLCGKTWDVVGQPIAWDMVPFDVQLLGAIALHEGKIAEMATGEGKTLVATLPIYLNALTGKGVHLVTVNDYLAKRDSEWMGAVFTTLGLTVGCIQNSMDFNQRRAAYACDITYGTNNEFGFDYLRDNMARHRDHRVQRGHHYAIVDEVDSVLIDEARTPLIISGPVEHSLQKYDEMRPDVDRVVRAQMQVTNSILAEAEGLIKDPEKEYEAGVKLLQTRRGAPKNKRLLKLLAEEPGLKRLIQRVELDFIRDKRLGEVDEDLFYSIDEKSHSVDLSEKGRLLLSQRDANLFLLPDLAVELGEIDASESLSPAEKVAEKKKLERVHGERSERVHNVLQLLKAYSLFEKDVEYVVQDGKILIVDEFTGRLMPGRRYSDGLHQAIEAKENVKVEGETQTLATITIQNYFRLYEKLAGMTGTAETEANEFWHTYKRDVIVIPTNQPARREDSNDVIFKTRREKYNALVDEIAELHEGKVPVLVGTISVEASETLSRLLKRKGVPHSVLNAKYHEQEAGIVAGAGRRGAVTIATNMAGRGTDIKLETGVIRCDRECMAGSQSRLRNGVWQNVARCKEEVTCGLHILGTERHESRRIDRQLRGRSGRQGDPGHSRFYLSLEDDLMRLFGSERIAGIMEKLGVQEGEVIEHGLVTRAIERAQRRVEAHNFDIRKHLLEYDDVMNRQRTVIYAQRLRALEEADLKETILEMMDEVVEERVETYLGGGERYDEEDWKRLGNDLSQLLLRPAVIPGSGDRMPAPAVAAEAFQEIFRKAYDEKETELSPPILRELERHVFLDVIDEHWMDHLREMDHMREGIGLRAYGQRDPLLEYKREAFAMFEELTRSIREETVRTIFRATLVLEPMPGRPIAVGGSAGREMSGGGASERPDLAPPPRVRVPRQETRHAAVTAFGTPEAQAGAAAPAAPPAARRAPMVAQEEKVGRNDPCPCGSGKKYKKCHGA
ncbi:MAG: preprotein translocase subunit SecA [Candidatus Eisenbacteria bacterium]|uniref:Protein translocase subunit SecA n=1 Tax=Eiseniibacteriota bacterium TaxID=2212470 RepID=A0A538TIR7_UNCEI|nr:MAG: preprotein translocase subunit SecA [Candidatus Eisenbacteria bacterium]